MAGSNTRKMAKLWQAAQEHDLTYSFVYRRWNGQIDLYKSKGLASVFSENEEAMARWLSEMAERGMWLRMVDLLGFVHSVVKKENRKVTFKDGFMHLWTEIGTL